MISCRWHSTANVLLADVACDCWHSGSQHSRSMDDVMLSQAYIGGGGMHPPASRTTAELSLARSRIVFGPPLRDPPKLNKRNTARNETVADMHIRQEMECQMGPAPDARYQLSGDDAGPRNELELPHTAAVSGPVYLLYLSFAPCLCRLRRLWHLSGVLFRRPLPLWSWLAWASRSELCSGRPCPSALSRVVSTGICLQILRRLPHLLPPLTRLPCPLWVLRRPLLCPLLRTRWTRL